MGEDIECLRAFFMTIGKLKETKRAGWLRVGISQCDAESIADHAFRTAVMTYVLSDGEHFDRNKAMKIALMHDLCESVCGDITPHDGITKQRKLDIEKGALEHLLSSLPSETRAELMCDWLEYESVRSQEGKYVKQIDILERIMQAREYLDKGLGDRAQLREFFDDARKIKNPKLKALCESVIKGAP